MISSLETTRMRLGGLPGFWATGAGLAVIALGLAAIRYGHVALPAIPGFLPAAGSIAVGADALTLLLVLSRARATPGRGLAWLAAGYGIAGLLMTSCLLVLPQAGAPLPGGAASWLWSAWQSGFAVCVGMFAVLDGAERRRLTMRRVAVAALAAAAVLALGAAVLPVSAGVALACTMAALVLILFRWPGGSTTDLWLGVALAAMAVEIGAGLLGDPAFSTGWYAGWALNLVAHAALLTGLLLDASQRFAGAMQDHRELAYLSVTDALTRLPNRRAFDAAFLAEWRRAQREMTPVSLLMIDIDQFKSLNDHLGHKAGDACLRQVAEVMRRAVRRPSDVAARLGGEEFALLLPNTDELGAVHLGERVRAGIEALQIPSPGAGRGIVTVSVGAATTYADARCWSPIGLMQRADAGLYQAKRAGRNFVQMAGPLAPAAELQGVRPVAAVAIGV